MKLENVERQMEYYCPSFLKKTINAKRKSFRWTLSTGIIFLLLLSWSPSLSTFFFYLALPGLVIWLISYGLYILTFNRTPLYCCGCRVDSLGLAWRQKGACPRCGHSFYQFDDPKIPKHVCYVGDFDVSTDVR